jgi:hypothetical protein
MAPRRAKPRWLLLVLSVTILSLVGATAAFAMLKSSTFESSDGNLVPNTSTDWNSVLPSTATTQIDLVKSKADDAFGQGTKEDDPNVNVVLGSIPPQKSDLSAFHTYVNKENGNQFLYLAWERTNQLGSANMDFELNQKTTDFKVTGGAATPGSYTIIRTPGDLLFTFDFGGSGAPSLGMLLWLTTSSAPTPISPYTTNVCYSASSFPCWGDRIDLTAAGLADGAVNTATVSDSWNPNGASLPANTFGEMGVNLTLALPNVFGPHPTTCESLGSAMLKSRSSSSFPAEVKDFIAPQTISVSNCGHILVHKTAADTGNGQAGATFTVTPGQTTSAGTTDDKDTIPGVTGQDGYYCIDNLLLGTTYTVAETAAPSGYLVDPNSPWTGLSPTAGSCSSVSYTTPPTATVNAVDPVARGSLKVVKTAKDHSATNGVAPLEGVSFTIWQGVVPAQVGSPVLTGANGVACFTNLLPGTYNVRETAPPTNYAGAADHNVTVTSGTDPTSCGTGSGTTVDPVSNTPLSKIEVTFSSSAGTGVTAATITCKDQSGGTITPDAGSTSGLDQSYSGLLPNSDATHNYTCTVNVDP